VQAFVSFVHLVVVDMAALTIHAVYIPNCMVVGLKPKKP